VAKAVVAKAIVAKAVVAKAVVQTVTAARGATLEAQQPSSRTVLFARIS
jgi:hypothetical protein